MKTSKRLLSILLSICFIASMLPSGMITFAEGPGNVEVTKADAAFVSNGTGERDESKTDEAKVNLPGKEQSEGEIDALPSGEEPEPGLKPGLKPGTEPGLASGLESGSKPGSKPETEPETASGLASGLESGSKPGTEPEAAMETEASLAQSPVSEAALAPAPALENGEPEFELLPLEDSSEIVAAVELADRVLAYASTDIGVDPYAFKQDKVDALTAAKNAANAIRESTDGAAVSLAVAAITNAVDELLDSNKLPGDPSTSASPQNKMTMTASTFHSASYAPEMAIDGNTGTMWHNLYSPSVAPRPHEIAVDLGRKQLIRSLSVLTRSDRNSGNIRTGAIYAGDSFDDLAFVMNFTSNVGQGATATLTLPYVYAKVVKISVATSNDDQTAIAELNVNTYDRGVSALNSVYLNALSVADGAIPGSSYGMYHIEDINGFKSQIESIFSSFSFETTKNSECYALIEQLELAQSEFEAKKIAITKDVLLQKITEARQLLATLPAGPDKDLFEAAIEAAEDIYDDINSAPADISGAFISLTGIAESILGAGDATMNLAGTWGLYLEEYNPAKPFEDVAALPGTLDENKRGTPNTVIDRERLSRYFIYTGPATYQKNVIVPTAWTGKRVELFMERTKRTRVWVNGTAITPKQIWDVCLARYPAALNQTQNLLTTPQIYDLADAIVYGAENEITIEVNNIILGMTAPGTPPNTNQPAQGIWRGHMGTEETQTLWNGILGKFELRAYQSYAITGLRAYPNPDLESVSVEVDIKNVDNAEQLGAKLTVQVEGLDPVTIDVDLPNDGVERTFKIPNYDMGDDVKLWSEFEQNFYNITASLANGSSKTERFGMRRFYVDPATKLFSINKGTKVWLRGETNCAVFPLTAYAPMDVESWKALFANYKKYGVNFVRFHSWCPPNAAFEAADELGLYLQPESSSWAQNMFGNAAGRNFWTAEAYEILKTNANHPSFVMFTLGNENTYSSTSLDGMNGITFGNNLVNWLQAADGTRLFARDSNGGTGSLVPAAGSDFFTSVSYPSSDRLRGNGWTNTFVPNTTQNYTTGLNYIRNNNTNNMAVFGFEVGQGLVFADVLTEIDKYTGLLEPRNFQYILDGLRDKGISDEKIKKYIEASGMSSRLLYRVEIEAALNTPGFSGMSLLGVQDFSGQKMALVGMMNALGEIKPYEFANPDEFKKFYSPVVPRANLSKLVWKNSEELSFDLRLLNFGPTDLSGPFTYKLYNKDGGAIVAAGTSDITSFPQGTWTDGGNVKIALSGVTEASQLVLELNLGDYQLEYNIWVYPDVADYELRENNKVYISEYYNDAVRDVLAAGGKVLICPAPSAANFNQSSGTVVGRTPNPFNVFWSSYDGNGTLGLLVDNNHPALAGFPTSYHSDFQWNRMSRSPVYAVNVANITNADGEMIQPIVEAINSAHHQATLGMLYEMKVGAGKLMISTMGLNALRATYPEAKALRDSILDYMNSDAFDPGFEVTPDKVSVNVRTVQLTLPASVELSYEKNTGDDYYTVTITTTGSGYEYSFDGINYSSSRVKADCVWGTEVRGYVRRAAAGGYSPSPAVIGSIALGDISGEQDLSGTWRLALDKYEDVLSTPIETVILPGTLDENKKGTPNTAIDAGKLNRYYMYTGPATYINEAVYVPSAWAGERVELYMERTKRTRVWVNGTEIAPRQVWDRCLDDYAIDYPIVEEQASNLLTTPHVYDLTGAIQYGADNVIAIEVDNYYLGLPPGMSTVTVTNAYVPAHGIWRGHMGTEETQTNWNGILGKFELRAYKDIAITGLRAYPNADLKSVTVEVDIKNVSGAEQLGAKLTAQVEGLPAATINVDIPNDSAEKTFKIPNYDMGDNVKLWSEFEQNFYNITASLENGDAMSERFGMRRFYVDPVTHLFSINNGTKVWLRGETNCAVFPLTAYAPMDVASWEALFTTYKEYGVNFVRFHSWCPPDAAFEAADNLGLYLQPECSSWSQNMFNNALSRGYWTAEAYDILRTFANHPSFVMFTLGNENTYGSASLSGTLGVAENGITFANRLVNKLQATDGTRLFARDSNGGTGSLVPAVNSDFFTSVQYPNGERLRGNGWTNTFVPNTTQNYTTGLNYIRNNNTNNMAVFGFEVGQGLVYADVLTEPEKYTGLLEARNFQVILDGLRAKGISDEKIKKYIAASGMSSRLLYRVEIEAALNTPGFSGMSLLGIQDFSGQLMALVGMVNALGEVKPYEFADPLQFRKFFSPVVPRANLSKLVWKNSETLTFDLKLNNFGPTDLTGAFTYSLYNKTSGAAVASGASAVSNFPQGTWTDGGTVNVPLSGISEASQLVLELKLDGTSYQLEYNIWVYPDIVDYELREDNEVYISEYYNDAVRDVLAAGGKVLLCPSPSAANFNQSSGSVVGRTPNPFNVFWSSLSGNGTLGLLVDDSHPALAGFPTSYHSDFQWNRMSRSPVYAVNVANITNADGEMIQPIVEAINSAHHQATLGLLYEMKVGAGKLVISTMGLNALRATYPEAKALRDSILDYMNSDAFDPEFEVTLDKVSVNVRTVQLALPSAVGFSFEKNTGDDYYTVTITTTGTNYEYSFDGINYSSSPVKVDCAGGSTVTGYVRLRANNGYSPSPAVTGSLTLGYTITVTVAAGLGGSVTGGGYFMENDPVTVIATADAGYIFEGWYENSVKIAGANETYSFSATANRALEARFVPKYTITVAAGTGGSVAGGGDFMQGAAVAVIASPNAGYVFEGWFENNAKVVGADETYTFEATANRTLEARFIPEYTVIVTAGFGGSVAGGGKFIEGAAVTVIATPNAGYMFEGWFENNVKVAGADETYTFEATVNRTLEARFSLIVIESATTSPKNLVSIMETSKNSRVWVLAFEVFESYSDGTTAVVNYSIQLNGNNANLDGKYTFTEGPLEGYTLVYDIKGNESNVKEFMLIK